MPDQAWIELPTPPGLSPWRRRRLGEFMRRAATSSQRGTSAQLSPIDNHSIMSAATRFMVDLIDQGWMIRVEGKAVQVRPPDEAADPTLEKERIRRQELLKRNEQLAKPSVREFVQRMEQPREFNGTSVSIFSLMRDGSDLADSLRRLRANAAQDPVALRQVIDPYIDVVEPGKRCAHTGLRTMDIWRYFRHTWANQYSSTPGRTLLLLVRDRAAPFHPVIGIACLASSVVQISERDEWIGWQPRTFLSKIEERPTKAIARWLLDRLDRTRDELHLDDLMGDGLYWPELWSDPTDDAIGRLRKEADARRRDHYRSASDSDLKRAPARDDEWADRAESDLFRGKRCALLADLLEARRALKPRLDPPTRKSLSHALKDAEARRVIASVLRRAKADAVGTEIADLVVCGAVPPYNALLGGKLVAMLSVSPAVLRAYRARYKSYASQIASSMAGRPIRRRTNLVFVGTTSLYGSGSSQYNRLRLPAELLGGTKGETVAFRQLGRSRSYGTSHLSSDTVAALDKLSTETHGDRHVNSIFGEGGNPKLRKIREGIDVLGWPSDSLLMHRRQRIVYGVSLVENLLSYLIGTAERPRYLVNTRGTDDVERISNWWYSRWLVKRISNDALLTALRRHKLSETLDHGARVQLPD